ncbi:MAG: RecX family transcriptional regulator [Alphaproteobacteria bacterium]|nr:RecX family transcriptional regulator [Alphaproteobacteria bacterium]
MLRPITYTRLKNIALFYLERYDASSYKLKTVLQRRIQKNIMQGDIVPPEVSEWIQTIVAECAALGYVNDSRYAENQARYLSEHGKSARFIQQKLANAGIPEQTIQDVLNQQTDYDRAKIFAHKKHLGSDYQKDMAKLARAGFSYEIAKQILTSGA